MLISVVIPTYNRCESLKAALNSLLNQENLGSIEYEVVVVDNCSVDKTKEVVESYPLRSLGKLKYLFEPKQGRSFALNTGVKESRGEIIAFTDDDCVVAPDWLAAISKIFLETNIDLLGGRVIPRFTYKTPEWFDIRTFRHLVVNFGDESEFLEGGGVVGCNSAVRRASYNSFGSYIHNTRLQDAELYYRWKKNGAKIAYSSKLIVYHYFAKERLEKSYVRKFYFLLGKNQSIISLYFPCSKDLIGIPRWVFKEVLLGVGKYFKNFFIPKENIFFREVYVLYQLGRIFGYVHKNVDPRF